MGDFSILKSLALRTNFNFIELFKRLLGSMLLVEVKSILTDWLELNLTF